MSWVNFLQVTCWRFCGLLTELSLGSFERTLVIRHLSTTNYGNNDLSLLSFLKHLCFGMKKRIYFSAQSSWVHWFGLFHLYCGCSCIAWNMWFNSQQSSKSPLEVTISLHWIWRKFSVISLQLSIRELDAAFSLLQACVHLAVDNLTQHSFDILFFFKIVEVIFCLKTALEKQVLSYMKCFLLFREPIWFVLKTKLQTLIQSLTSSPAFPPDKELYMPFAREDLWCFG